MQVYFCICITKLHNATNVHEHLLTYIKYARKCVCMSANWLFYTRVVQEVLSIVLYFSFKWLFCVHAYFTRWNFHL